MTLVSEFSSGLDDIYSVAGVSATYTDVDGATSTVTVIIDRDLSTYGDSAEVTKATATIAVRVSDMALPPRRGETFTVDGKTYRVNSTLTSDELEHSSLVS